MLRIGRIGCQNHQHFPQLALPLPLHTPAGEGVPAGEGEIDFFI